MGYTVLYTAFGGVALWLLAEVLFQKKSRLRWRVLAFAGFLGVVLGVYLPSVIVIALGAAAFGTGQTFVTLSYRRGFTSGWAIPVPGRSGADKPEKPAAGKRRRRGRDEEAEAEPVLQTSSEPVESVAAGTGGGVGPGPDAVGPDAAEGQQAQESYGAPYEDADSATVYQPTPLIEESGEYPLFNHQPSYTSDPYAGGGYEGYGAQGYDSWNGEQQPSAPAYSQQQGDWAAQEAFPAPGDPYAGYGYQDPGPQSQDQSSYGYETPAGGVWVPQQPSGDGQQPYIPQQSQYDQGQQPPYEQQYVDPSDPYRY